jgi:hypothetical protein
MKFVDEYRDATAAQQYAAAIAQITTRSSSSALMNYCRRKLR